MLRALGHDVCSPLRFLAFGAIVGIGLLRTTHCASPETMPERVRSGLLVLYDFATADRAFVNDRAGVGQPLNSHHRLKRCSAVGRRFGDHWQDVDQVRRTGRASQ